MRIFLLLFSTVTVQFLIQTLIVFIVSYPWCIQLRYFYSPIKKDCIWLIFFSSYSVMFHVGMALSDETLFVSRGWGVISVLLQPVSVLIWTNLLQSRNARWASVCLSGSQQSGARWEMMENSLIHVPIHCCHFTHKTTNSGMLYFFYDWSNIFSENATVFVETLSSDLFF